MGYERQRTTRKLDTLAPNYPVKDQDTYLPQDHNRDGMYHDGKLGDALREIYNNIPSILYGCVASINAGGGTLDFTTGVALSEIDEEIENGIFAADMVRMLYLPVLSDWMDSNADDAGATNYIKLKYIATDHSDTREYLYKSGTYNYKQIDDYELTADTTPPVAGEVCLGEFQKTAGTITSLTFINKSPSAELGRALIGIRKNSAGTTFERRRINFIEGSAIIINVTDDPTDEEIDVTISGTSGATYRVTEIENITGLEFFESVGGVEIVNFPVDGTPEGRFDFLARKFGVDEVVFFIKYQMSEADTGVVKLDADIYINEVFWQSKTDTIDPVNDTTVGLVELTNIRIPSANYTDKDFIRIELSRDNTVGSNHIGKFGVVAILAT